MKTHKLRKALKDGSVPQIDSPLAEKGERSARQGKRGGLVIPRETTRKTNHRNEDRYPVVDEYANAAWRDETSRVRVVNFSSNGLQIECTRPALIGEMLAVSLGDCEPAGCAVRWIRGHRIGLEFVDETQILSDAGVVGYVIESIKTVLTASGERIDRRVGVERRGQAMRHGMIWFGCLQFDGQTCPVRLRNISRTGALVHMDSMIRVKRGKSLALDLGSAGTVAAEVIWAAGDELGLRFAQDFDVSLLSELPAADVELLETGTVPRPERLGSYPVTIGDWEVPVHCAPPPESGRLTLEELYATLYPKGRSTTDGQVAAEQG